MWTACALLWVSVLPASAGRVAWVAHVNADGPAQAELDTHVQDALSTGWPQATWLAPSEAASVVPRSTVPAWMADDPAALAERAGAVAADLQLMQVDALVLVEQGNHAVRGRVVTFAPFKVFPPREVPSCPSPRDSLVLLAPLVLADLRALPAPVTAPSCPRAETPPPAPVGNPPGPETAKPRTMSTRLPMLGGAGVMLGGVLALAAGLAAVVAGSAVRVALTDGQVVGRMPTPGLRRPLRFYALHGPPAVSVPAGVLLLLAGGVAVLAGAALLVPGVVGT